MSGTPLQHLEPKQPSEPALPPGVEPSEAQVQVQAQAQPATTPAAAQPQAQSIPAAGQQNPPVNQQKRPPLRVRAKQFLRRHVWKIPFVVVAAFTVPTAVFFLATHVGKEDSGI